MPSSEAVALYRRYAESCVNIAGSLSTIRLKIELLVMARTWTALANEAEENSRAEVKEAEW